MRMNNTNCTIDHFFRERYDMKEDAEGGLHKEDEPKQPLQSCFIKILE